MTLQMGEDLESPQSMRVVKNMLVQFPYSNSLSLEWVGKWLKQSYNFKLTGKLEGIGYKLGEMYVRPSDF